MGSNEAVSEKPYRALSGRAAAAAAVCAGAERVLHRAVYRRRDCFHPLAGEALSDGHGEGHVSGEDRLCRKPCAAGQGRCACNAAHFTAQLLSGCFAGASGCAALGRALRRQADKTVDEMPDGGRQRKGRGKASARGLFCLAGAGEALRRCLPAYGRSSKTA